MRNYIREEQLHNLLRILDKEVTGKSETHPTFNDFPTDFEYGGVTYHLSDGGYSNVFFRVDVEQFTGNLFINDTATKEIEEKFNKLRVLRAIIETFYIGGQN